ncbi:collagen alpha-1(I) chain-like, partial [Pipra filicauda]|uniref:Collagen alpha-1(I) chain-like n=1 Tax=Pipra filicauda TaxID=649802 RepID=A0A7R5KDX6_9PASS
PGGGSPVARAPSARYLALGRGKRPAWPRGGASPAAALGGASARGGAPDVRHHHRRLLARGPGFPSVARHRTREDACGSDRPAGAGTADRRRSSPRAPHAPTTDGGGPPPPPPARRTARGPERPARALLAPPPLGPAAGGGSEEPPPRKAPRRPPFAFSLSAVARRAPAAPLAPRAPRGPPALAASEPPPARSPARAGGRTGKRPRRRRAGRGGGGGGGTPAAERRKTRKRGARGAPSGGGPAGDPWPPAAGGPARRRGPRARANSEPRRGPAARRGRRSAAPPARARRCRRGRGLRPAGRAPLSGGGRTGDGPARRGGPASGAASAQLPTFGRPAATRGQSGEGPARARGDGRAALVAAGGRLSPHAGRAPRPPRSFSLACRGAARGSNGKRRGPAAPPQPPPSTGGGGGGNGGDRAFESAGATRRGTARRAPTPAASRPPDSQVRPSSRRSARAVADPAGADPRTSLNHPIGSSDGRINQVAATRAAPPAAAAPTTAAPAGPRGPAANGAAPGRGRRRARAAGTARGDGRPRRPALPAPPRARSRDRCAAVASGGLPRARPPFPRAAARAAPPAAARLGLTRPRGRPGRPAGARPRGTTGRARGDGDPTRRARPGPRGPSAGAARSAAGGGAATRCALRRCLRAGGGSPEPSFPLPCFLSLASLSGSPSRLRPHRRPALLAAGTHGHHPDPGRRRHLACSQGHLKGSRGRAAVTQPGTVKKPLPGGRGDTSTATGSPRAKETARPEHRPPPRLSAGHGGAPARRGPSPTPPEKPHPSSLGERPHGHSRSACHYAEDGTCPRPPTPAARTLLSPRLSRPGRRRVPPDARLRTTHASGPAGPTAASAERRHRLGGAGAADGPRSPRRHLQRAKAPPTVPRATGFRPPRGRRLPPERPGDGDGEKNKKPPRKKKSTRASRSRRASHGRPGLGAGPAPLAPRLPFSLPTGSRLGGCRPLPGSLSPSRNPALRQPRRRGRPDRTGRPAGAALAPVEEEREGRGAAASPANGHRVSPGLPATRSGSRSAGATAGHTPAGRRRRPRARWAGPRLRAEEGGTNKRAEARPGRRLARQRAVPSPSPSGNRPGPGKAARPPPVPGTPPAPLPPGSRGQGAATQARAIFGALGRRPGKKKPARARPFQPRPPTARNNARRRRTTGAGLRPAHRKDEAPPPRRPRTPPPSPGALGEPAAATGSGWTLLLGPRGPPSAVPVPHSLGCAFALGSRLPLPSSDPPEEAGREPRGFLAPAFLPLVGLAGPWHAPKAARQQTRKKRGPRNPRC